MPRRPSNGSPTIPEVARKAGVSPATAARALGGYGSVRASTRDHVLAVAEELGYRPNEVARTMITGRSNTIGLVIADIENPFFARAARGVSDAARAAGYEVVVTNTDEDLDVERSTVKVLLSKQVDGIIVAPTSTDAEHLAAAQRAGCPVVLFDRRIDGFSVDAVLVDNYAASRDAVERLLAVGHRRIAMVTGGTSLTGQARPGAGISTGHDRIDGYLAALRDAGVDTPTTYLRTGASDPELARALTHDLLAARTPPTAVFASDSRRALGVLRALREAHVSVPEQMSLVAFDDADWASIVTPPLSVVAQPTHELGRQAAQILTSRIAGSDGPPQLHMLATQFLNRESISPPDGALG